MAVCLTASANDELMQFPLKGRILDQDKNPLPGAVVYIDATGIRQ